MINENTKLFILDNLNKRDFLTEEFLNELKEVMDFYDNLYLYFNGFELKDSSLANTTVVMIEMIKKYICLKEKC